MEILRERGVEFDTLEYLETPLDRSVLERLLDRLPGPPADLVRKDKHFDRLGLAPADCESRDAVCALLLAHPELMQRPIFEAGGRAVIARPSERVLELLVPVAARCGAEDPVRPNPADGPMMSRHEFMAAEMPVCSHRPPCPGCPRYAEGGVSERALADLRRLLAETGNPRFEIVEGAEREFRLRARLAVRGRGTSPKIGIFQKGSHRIVDIPHCQTHHPLINRVAAATKQAIRATGVHPYAERPHRGDLRTLQVVVERRSLRAQVVLVGNGVTPAPLAATAAALIGELGDGLHSLWWNGNPERTNTLLGPHWELLHGEPAVQESIAGAEVYFPPGAFGQSHLDLADALAERVAAWIPGGARVAEFYAGCGALGLGLLRRGSSVGFNELNPHGLWGLELGIAAQGGGARDRAGIAAGPATECLGLLREADAVLVDPPRRGLGDEFVSALVASPPERLVYVSCDRGSFERDARRLLADGQLRLVELVAYGFFPNTHHVEIAARFER